MKSINKKDFIQIGSVLKVHGTKGELKVILNLDIEFNEWAFLEIREKPVPFYIESCKHQFQEEAFLKLREINTMEEASKYVGYAVLALKKSIKKAALNQLDDSILHYKIIDSKFGEMGIVDEIIEMPMQVLLKTTFNGQELLIPAVEPILTDITDKKKIVYIQMPEGLLDI